MANSKLNNPVNKHSLYRWKRWNEPKSTISQKTLTEDLQDWTKTLHEASDKAATATFGRNHGTRATGVGGRINATVDALHDQDDAYTEAQELLNQWMEEKCNLESELDFSEEAWSSSNRARPNRLEIQQHWENLLDTEMVPLHNPSASVPQTSENLFSEIENCNEDAVVSSILDNLRHKQVVEDDFLKDIGLDESKNNRQKDPRTKMQVRHQQVKKNREKRLKEREEELKKKQLQKEIQTRAKQQILKEEKEKSTKIKHEESLILQEMAKIKKEMEEQRIKTEELKQREKKQKEADIMKAQRELQKILEEEQAAKLRKQQQQEQNQIEQKLKLEKIRAFKAGKNLKCLQRHFSAWYGVVQDKQIEMGKTRAVSEWRCLVKSWNIWKSQFRSRMAEREARQAQSSMKDAYRKMHIATEFHSSRIKKRCLTAWYVWHRLQVQSQQVEQEQQETRKKMSTFLEAAASGKLWTGRREGESLPAVDTPPPGKSNNQYSRQDSTRQKIDEIFAQNSNAGGSGRIHSGHTERRHPWAVDSSTPSQHQVRRPAKPTQAWQVTRKHLNLTKEEMMSLAQGTADVVSAAPEANGDGGPESGERQAGRAKDKPIQYTVNNFSNRFLSQQKILQEQQKQLKEQKRLIEDLQASHRQYLLQQQLNTITGGSGNDNGDGKSDVAVAAEGHETARSDAKSDVSSAVSEQSGKTESTSSTLLNNHIPHQTPIFLKNMEERALKRAQRKAENDERKRKKEEEKLQKLKEEEERLLAEAVAEKKANLEKIREEKRIARQKEQKKQQQLDLIAKGNSKADQHYRKTLLINKGMKPWKKLLTMCRQNMQVAEDHGRSELLRRHFTPWRQLTERVVREKQGRADQLFNRILLARTLSSWKKYGYHQSIQLQKARRYYVQSQKAKYFRLWQEFVNNEKMKELQQEQVAREHFIRRTKGKVFLEWKNIPLFEKRQRERANKLEEMRKKVSSILPDFGK